MQVSPERSQPDEELAARAAGGDQAAFAALYERYFDGIFDFAVRTVRDPDAAAKAAQRTFTVAWEGMRRGWGGRNVKPWLYTIARNSAIDELRRAKGAPSAGEDGEGGGRPQFAQVDPSRSPSAQVLEDKEMVDLVWSSAAALRPKQYSLLDMHLRQGLTADGLAESLRLTKGNIYTMQTRLREALAESVTYTLLIRRGRRECRELDHLLSEIKAGEHAHETRRAVRDHLRTCARCQTSKRGYVSPLAVFGALALVPAAPGVKESVWHGILSHINVITAPGGRAARKRFAPPHANLPLVAAAGGGGVGLLAILLAGVLVFGSGGGAAPVRDPADVHSTDREPGDPSSDSTIEIAWTPVPGVQAYSIMWTQGRNDVPDSEGDLPGTAAGAKSPRLEPGTWYFHLRTQGPNGRWTSTVHLGPFEVIEGSGDTPRGTASPSPSPETGTPAPIPQFPTEAAAPQTETPPPAPAATPTVTATATPNETPVPPPEPTDTSTPGPTSP